MEGPANGACSFGLLLVKAPSCGALRGDAVRQQVKRCPGGQEEGITDGMKSWRDTAENSVSFPPEAFTRAFILFFKVMHLA